MMMTDAYKMGNLQALMLGWWHRSTTPNSTLNSHQRVFYIFCYLYITLTVELMEKDLQNYEYLGLEVFLPKLHSLLIDTRA